MPTQATRLLVLTLVFASACAGESWKGEEDGAIADEKADSFFSPTEMGELSFAEPSPGAFTDDVTFLAYHFELSEAASFLLETVVDDVGTDTVMYLYRRDPGGTWGPFVAKNDDFGDSVTSRIDLDDAAAGEYRLIVKPFSMDIRGTFQVLASCVGAGCPVVAECDPEIESMLLDCVHEEREAQEFEIGFEDAIDLCVEASSDVRVPPCGEVLREKLAPFCPVEVKEWITECAEEQMEDTDFSFADGVELCTDSPFAGLGDEPIEVFEDICFLNSPLWCDGGEEAFEFEFVPHCVEELLQ